MDKGKKLIMGFLSRVFLRRRLTCAITICTCEDNTTGQLTPYSYHTKKLTRFLQSSKSLLNGDNIHRHLGQNTL